MTDDVLLVPIANPASADRLLATATDLARAFDMVIDVLHVVRVPPQLSMSDAPNVLDVDTSFVFEMVDAINDSGLTATARIRYARSISKGIITATEDPSVSTALLGWRGRPQRRDIILGSYLDNVVNRAQSDVLIERVDEGGRSISSICLPVAGGPHTELAARVAGGIAHINDASVEVIHVIRPDGSHSEGGETYIQLAMDAISYDVEVIGSLVEHEDVTSAIVDHSANHDLTVMGAAEEGLLSQALFGAIPERVGRDAMSGVLLAKRQLPAHKRLSLLHRWF